MSDISPSQVEKRNWKMTKDSVVFSTYVADDSIYQLDSKRGLRRLTLIALAIFYLLPIPALIFKDYAQLFIDINSVLPSFFERQVSLLHGINGSSKVGYVIAGPIFATLMLVFSFRLYIATRRFFLRAPLKGVCFEGSYFLCIFMVVISVVPFAGLIYAGSIVSSNESSRLYYWVQWPLSGLLGLSALMVFTAGFQGLVVTYFSNSRRKKEA